MWTKELPTVAGLYFIRSPWAPDHVASLIKDGGGSLVDEDCSWTPAQYAEAGCSFLGPFTSDDVVLGIEERKNNLTEEQQQLIISAIGEKVEEPHITIVAPSQSDERGLWFATIYGVERAVKKEKDLYDICEQLGIEGPTVLVSCKSPEVVEEYYPEIWKQLQEKIEDANT